VSESGRARILSIGTELTDGVIANTHFRFLGSQLKSLGFRVVGGEQVPDQLELILAALGRAAAEAELVLVTGGLGPTSDDLTREAVAQAAGVGLEFRPQLWQRLLERYASSGQQPAQSNRRQAFIPAGFQAIPNDRGTAPGFWGRLGGRLGGALMAALPGPPSELEPMFQERLLPLLQAQFPSAGSAAELVATSVLVPESALEDALRRHRRGEVVWGTRVAEDRIDFWLRGGSAEERAAVLVSLQAQFGAARVRRGSLRPSESLLAALERRGERLGLAESCTGGPPRCSPTSPEARGSSGGARRCTPTTPSSDCWGSRRMS
jgi:nicotinamide-nucleotide amidase